MQNTYKYTNWLISKIKGTEYSLDKRIPLSYLLNLLLHKGICLIWGFFVFKKSERAFLHVSSQIKCVNMIKYDSNLNIDKNCQIDALSRDGIIFGRNVSIGKNTTIECTGSLKSLGKGLIIGDNVGLGTNGFWGCAGGVEIGSDTIFGNFVSIHSENHNFKSLDIPIRLQGVNRKGIKIGNNCWIGAKATILDGAIIEDGCIIAAGALVISGRYKSNGIYGGVPAKLIKYRLNE